MLSRLILSAVLLAATSARADCETHFTFKDPRVDLTGSKFLGRGLVWDTRTWLLREGDEFVTEKDFGRECEFDNELAALEVHAWLERTGEPTGVRPPEDVCPVANAKGGRRAYRRRFYPGRSVLDLVRDVNGTSADVRARVKAAYLESFARFQRNVEAYLGPQKGTWWNYEHRLPWLEANVPAGMVPGHACRAKIIKITMKPDNVLVDPWTLALTRIDPH